jgi:hypothetical protein
MGCVKMDRELYMTKYNLSKSPLVFLKLSNFNPFKHEEERESVWGIVRDTTLKGVGGNETFRLLRVPGSVQSSF